MQALCGLQGIFDLFNCKTPARNVRNMCCLYKNKVKNYKIKQQILVHCDKMKKSLEDG